MEKLATTDYEIHDLIKRRWSPRAFAPRLVEPEKIKRMLEAARWDDIWKYLRLSQVREWFPRLKLRPQTRAVWEHALAVWGQTDGCRQSGSGSGLCCNDTL